MSSLSSTQANMRGNMQSRMQFSLKKAQTRARSRAHTPPRLLGPLWTARMSAGCVAWDRLFAQTIGSRPRTPGCVLSNAYADAKKHTRSGLWRSKSGSGMAFLVHFPQKTLPHARQWCFLLKKLNSSLQSAQARQSSSLIHTTTLCLRNAGLDGSASSALSASRSTWLGTTPRFTDVM